MWQEGQEEEEEDFFDDVPESFVLCALHQAKIIRERWKFWSGTVPANVSIRLHRLESRLSINEEVRQRKSITEMIEENEISLQQMSKMNSSEPFLPEIHNDPIMDNYVIERIEPKQNIIIQGPDIRRFVEQKRRVHFWCCH